MSGLGGTGQMYGMVLLDTKGAPCSPFIGWQDRRCHEQLPGGQTYISRIMDVGDDGFAKTGCRPATGYMASALFWLAQNDVLPANTSACFAPDYLVSQLCENRAVTDATNAAGAGVFNLIEKSLDSRGGGGAGTSIGTSARSETFVRESRSNHCGCFSTDWLTFGLTGTRRLWR